MGKALSKPNSNSGRAACSDYHDKAALTRPDSFNKGFLINSSSAFMSDLRSAGHKMEEKKSNLPEMTPRGDEPEVFIFS